MTTLKLQLTLREQGYLVRKTTDNLEAYDSYLRGVEYCYRLTQETNVQARQLFEQALALDPQYGDLPLPEPLFLPPPVSLFTVAHARASASFFDTPFFS